MRAGLERVGRYVAAYGTMHFLAELHIGGLEGAALDCGDEAQIETLLQTVGEIMELGHAEHIMLCYDDVAPVLQKREAEKYTSPAQAHGAAADRVYRFVKQRNPDALVSFCTPYYQGRGHIRWQLEQMRATGLDYLSVVRDWPNKDIRIVWTGPVTESRRITAEDIASYKEWVGRDTLFYWDNTWHYHQAAAQFPRPLRRRIRQGLRGRDELHQHQRRPAHRPLLCHDRQRLLLESRRLRRGARLAGRGLANDGTGRRRRRPRLLQAAPTRTTTFFSGGAWTSMPCAT